MPITERQREALETTISGVETTGKALEHAAKAVGIQVSAIAWIVGLVSPGFLGLLWNAADLKRASTLGSSTFTSCFIGSELLFLLSLVSALIAHKHATAVIDAIGRCHMITFRIITAFQMLKSGIDVQEHLKASEGASSDALRESQALVALQAMPPYVQWAGRLYDWLAIAGYLCLGIILATLRF